MRSSQAFVTPTFFRLPYLSQPPPSFRRLSMTASTAQNPASTALITGASGGIGAQTALALPTVLPNLTHLLLASRDPSKTSAVAAAVRAASPRPITITTLPLELGHISSVRACAAAASAALGDTPLDVLINNAGVMACPLAFSSDGIESQYAVNHLGAAALTSALLPELHASKRARVIFVSSLAVTIARARKRAALPREKTRGALQTGKYEKWGAYGESKQAMSMFAKGLSRKAVGVTALSLHPGVVQTELGRHIAPKWFESLLGSNDAVKGASQKFFSLFGLLTPEEGAQMSLELVGCADEAIKNGAFYVAPDFKQGGQNVIPLLDDQAACDELYDATMAFLKTV